MRVEGFDGTHDIDTVQALMSVLAKRHNLDVNSFWLAHDNKKYPSVALLLKGDLASLHYFPRDSHPGFVPAAGGTGLSKGGTTVFCIDPGGEEIQILNAAVLPFAVALQVARDFFKSGALPPSIKWEEL